MSAVRENIHAIFYRSSSLDLAAHSVDWTGQKIVSTLKFAKSSVDTVIKTKVETHFGAYFEEDDDSWFPQLTHCLNSF
jgi:hypothetical protein